MSDGLPSAGEIGARLPRFRIERQIGQGGMSVVYLAEDLGPLQRKRVAIKVLAPALAADETFRARFVRESQIVANLEHPHVIPVYDAGADGSLLYLVMRYIDGPDLRALLHSTGPMELPRVVSVIGQIAGALDAAHRQGLVHRDVKPANVLVDRPGEPDEHCYLCDFGITKSAASAETLTGTGTFVGTLDYIAPEQIEGRPLDPRTDVYALGCVVYQLLTGSVPYPLETDMAKMLAHVREPPPSVRAVRPDLAPNVDEVIGRAMAKDPAERFSSCGDLARALSGTTVSAARPTATDADATVTRDAVAMPPVVTPAAPSRARPPARVLAAAGAGALLLVVVLVVALSGGGGLSGKEKALVARVPVGERDSCTRQGGRPAGATAFVRCKGKGGVATYTLAAFKTRAATDAAYRREADTSPISKDRVGDCFEFTGENHAFGNSKDQHGQVLCYRRGTAESVIVWTDPADPVLGRATRNDDQDNPLYFWWAAFVDRPDSDTFPLSKEQALLDKLAPSIRETCSRGNQQHGDQVAAVTCAPPDGPPTVSYTSFGDRAALDAAYGAVIDGKGIGRDSGDSNGCPSEGGYVYKATEAEGGRRVCFFDGPTARLTWTESSQLVLIEAVSASGDYANLFDWEHSGVGQPG